MVGKNVFQLGLVSIIFTILLHCGCDTVYYNTMEAFGKHKRDILVERVSDARDSQAEAKEQFKSALEEFSSVLNFEGGELEAKYEKLNGEYEKSEAKANAVRSRIQDVKNVATALFKEWAQELEEYSSERLRRVSEQKLEQTRDRYEQLIGAMERAESKIGPVLVAFRDQVLFLKHNLNAQAIASLQEELGTIENNIASLVAEMERSIEEADAFVKAMTDAGS
jgi:chromosome segregation ATPase